MRKRIVEARELPLEHIKQVIDAMLYREGLVILKGESEPYQEYTEYEIMKKDAAEMVVPCSWCDLTEKKHTAGCIHNPNKEKPDGKKKTKGKTPAAK